MTPQEFLDEFGTLAEAEGGVQKLRELILELAVRGKLVEQDEDDEPASLLFERIRAERDRQFSEKIIRRGKALPDRIENELGFEIPLTWEWTQFGELGDWGAGATPRRGDDRYYGGDILWLKSGELNDGTVTESEEKITPKALEDCSLRLNQPGDVLVAMYGATIGKLAIAGAECTTNQAVCACTCFDGVFNRFLFLLLKAAKRFFIANSSGAAQPNFSKEKIVRTSAPLPPLAEQHRIVAKVDELMRLCDGLEAVQKQRRGVRLRLNRSSLDRLTVVQSPAQVSAAWQRVCDHFEVLYDTPETLPDLRQTILQLAVQGKLVKQDPNDEPAAELLERVACEKRNRIEQKKMKQQWVFNQIKDTDAPFDLASGWQWSRIIDAVERVTVGHVGSMRTQYVSEGVPFLRCQNVRENRFDPLGMEFISAEFHEQLAKSRLEPRDVVVVRTGAMVGMTCVIPNSLEDANCSDLVIIKQPMALISEYVSFFMNLMAKRNSEEQVVGIAIPHFNTKSVAALPIPVPPLPEQKRIVSKVTDLLSQVTRLESTLTRREATRTQLLTAAIHGLLSKNADYE
ncbi:MAG: restriction endonuclease subunit S [Planctomycetaceae bacterium]